jgi:tetratricopeptide (TPR) repeat protein
LFEDERRVFERLSVLPGGCVIDAAEAVCVRGDSDATDVDVGDVVELINGLVEKSLVVVDRFGSEPRYRLLQTLSQYGRERLVERGEADAVFGRMATHFAALCAGSRTAFRGVDQRQWYLAIDAEEDNIRTAFEWAVGAEEKELAVAIAVDIALSRWLTGGAREGYRCLDTALALPGDVAPFMYGRALVYRAFLGHITTLGDRVDEQFEEGIALLREHADAVFTGHALTFYAQVVGEKGRPQQATELNIAAVELFEAVPDDVWACGIRTWLQALIAVQGHGDFETFQRLLPEARDRFRAAGDVFMTAVCLDLVAEFDEFRGDFDAAAAGLREALETVAGLRMARFEVALTARAGTVAVMLGDHAAAEVLLRDALTRAVELSALPVRAQALNALANLRRRQGQLDVAEGAASDALAMYREASGRKFSSSFSRAASPADVPAGSAASLSVLGFVAEARGDAVHAIEHHRAAYEHVRTVPHPRAVPLALEGLAAAAALAGDGEWTVQLLGCVDRLRSERGAVRAPSEQLDVDRAHDAAATLLGRGAIAAAHEQGRQSSVEALVTGPVVKPRA